MTFILDGFRGTSPNTPRARSAGPRLAIVEDNDELRDRIMVPALRAAGFDAIGLANALQLYRVWAGSPFDLVLLDVGLPDDDGVEVARHLRGLSPSPGIVMYTGHGRTADRVRGLRAGVDAYVVKPADMDEVIETLHNVHRRRMERDARSDAPAGNGWSFDRQGWLLVTPSGATVSLNQSERQVMAALAAKPCEPVTREALIGLLTGEASEFDPHRLDMLVYRLRRKVGQACGETLPLRTVRGMGYALDW